MMTAHLTKQHDLQSIVLIFHALSNDFMLQKSYKFMSIRTKGAATRSGDLDIVVFKSPLI